MIVDLSMTSDRAGQAESGKIVLLHGTSSRFMRRIMRNGLLPRHQSGNSVYAGEVTQGGQDLESNPELVYLTDTYPIAFAGNAVRKYGGNLMVVGVVVSSDDLLPDEDFAHQCENAKQCLHDYGTCAVRPEKIQRLTAFYLPTMRDLKALVGRGSANEIHAGLKHHAFGPNIRDNTQFILSVAKQYVLRDGEWIKRNYD